MPYARPRRGDRRRRRAPAADAEREAGKIVEAAEPAEARHRGGDLGSRAAARGDDRRARAARQRADRRRVGRRAAGATRRGRGRRPSAERRGAGRRTLADWRADPAARRRSVRSPRAGAPERDGDARGDGVPGRPRGGARRRPRAPSREDRRAGQAAGSRAGRAPRRRRARSPRRRCSRTGTATASAPTASSPGSALIGGRRVCLMANDPTVKAGSWGPKTVEKILRIQERALSLELPMIYLVDSAGRADHRAGADVPRAAAAPGGSSTTR